MREVVWETKSQMPHARRIMYMEWSAMCSVHAGSKLAFSKTSATGFNIIIHMTDQKKQNFWKLKRLIFLSLYNGLPFLSVLICGWCSYSEVTAVLKPNHAQIWLVFRICLLFYTPSCPIGFSSLYVSKKRDILVLYRNTNLSGRSLPLEKWGGYAEFFLTGEVRMKVFIKIWCNMDLVQFTTTLKLSVV